MSYDFKISNGDFAIGSNGDLKRAENTEKLSFKDYYDSIDTDQKNYLRDKMYEVGMANSTFYYKVREEKFTILELKELGVLTNQNFEK